MEKRFVTRACCLVLICAPRTLKKLPVTLVAVALILVFDAGSLLAQSSDGGTWSVNVGPNAKNWGYVGLTKDFLINEHISLFVTGGVGATLIGGGAAYYVTSFHQNSFVFSSTAGVVGAYVDAGYQWKVGKRGFITTGVSYGSYFLQHKGFLPVLSYELRF